MAGLPQTPQERCALQRERGAGLGVGGTAVVQVNFDHVGAEIGPEPGTAPDKVIG